MKSVKQLQTGTNRRIDGTLKHELSNSEFMDLIKDEDTEV